MNLLFILENDCLLIARGIYFTDVVKREVNSDQKAKGF